MEELLNKFPRKAGAEKREDRLAKKKIGKKNITENLDGEEDFLVVDKKNKILVREDDLEISLSELDMAQAQLEDDRRNELLAVQGLVGEERIKAEKLIDLGYEKKLLDEKMRIEIEKISNAPGLDDEMKAELIESIKIGHQEKIEELANNEPSVKDKSKTESEEISWETIEINMEEKGLDYLFNDLKKKIEALALKNNLSGKEWLEQDKKVLGSLKSDIAKVKRRKDSAAKLAKIKEIQGEMEKRIEGDIFGEENKKSTQEAIIGNDKKKLDEIAHNIETSLGGDIETAEKETTDEVENDEDDDVEKELSPISTKAIKDKNFAHDLMKHEMDKLEKKAWGKGKAVKNKDFAHDSMDHKINKELKDVSIESAQTIAKEIDKSKKDLVVVFDKFRDNFAKFLKNINDSEDDKSFAGELEKTINGYARRIREFDTIDAYDTKTLTKINQLHYELQEWADRNWVQLYERKMGRGVAEKETEIVLHELDDKDLHGDDGLVTKSVEEIEQANEDKLKGENLSEEERIELVSLIGEKLADVESDYELLMKKFHDFRKKNEDEIAYSKTILRKTLDFHKKKVEFGKIVKGNIQLNQELLNNLIDLDKEIIDLTQADWDNELKEFKREIEFSEIQEEKIKIVTELFKKKNYIESLSGAKWDGYREEDKTKAIELITKSQLRLILSTMKDIFDNAKIIEKAVNETFIILNENK